MALESQTLKDVETRKGIYALASKDKPESKEREIFDMISDFRDFCTEYTKELSALSASKSSDWLQNAVDNVLLDYWEPILRAAEQHRAAHYSALFQKGYEQLKSLQKKLEKRLTFQMDVHIVLYFEKIGKAKRFPFGSTYLIGIPLIDGYREDWMAIPHELGHHIFWNSRFSDLDTTLLPARGTNFLAEEVTASVEKLTPKLTGKTPEQNARVKEHVRKILDDWTEEIFADVVGTRISGMDFVSAAPGRVLRRVETGRKRELFISDGEHPIPYLLPYIRAFAMNLHPEPFVPWKEYGGVNFETLIPNDDPYNPISIRLLRDVVIKTFVKGIIEKLKNVEIDELISGTSPVTELKKFIKSTVSNERKTKTEILISLLNPVILEKNEEWTCRNGHTNSGDRSFCSTCSVAHYWWNFIIG